MGNSLNRHAHSPTNKHILAQLKQCSLSNLSDCLRVLTEDYADCSCLDFQQFSDVFAPLTEDPEPLFLMLQNNKDINGVVDIYESLAVFGVFAREKFEARAAFIFQLFDFDKNKSLDRNELVLTLQSVARGLCKSIDITPPSRVELAETGENLFTLIDRDHNQRITFDEFMLWINTDKELQDFLLHHVGTQTFQNLNYRFNVIYRKFLTFFTLVAGYEDAEYAGQEKLKAMIKKEEKNDKRDSEIEFLFEVLRNTTLAKSLTNFEEKENLISRDAYESAIKAWCAFYASDFNGDDFLVSHELHALLWLYEEKEPSHERVEYEMKEMGKSDHTGVNMMDWMKNLCVINKQGKFLLRTNLKKMFEKYDTDNSGYLSIPELKELVREPLKHYIMSARREASVVVTSCLESIVDSLTKELFSELDANKNTQVSWEEFKAYVEISPHKFEKVKKFLDANL